MKQWRGCSSRQDFTKIRNCALSPQNQKGQPGCLCCVPQSTTGTCPTRQWAEPIITLSHLDSACLVSSAGLHIFIEKTKQNKTFFTEGKKRGKKILVSEPSAGVLFLCWLFSCNSNTATSTVADARTAVASALSPRQPVTSYLAHCIRSPLVRGKGFPQPWSCL